MKVVSGGALGVVCGGIPLNSLVVLSTVMNSSLVSTTSSD